MSVTYTFAYVSKSSPGYLERWQTLTNADQRCQTLVPHIAMLLLVLSTAHCILVCHLLYNVPPSVGRVTSGSVWLEVHRVCLLGNPAKRVQGNVPKTRTPAYFRNSTNLHGRASSPSWQTARQGAVQTTKGETGSVRN